MNKYQKKIARKTKRLLKEKEKALQDKYLVYPEEDKGYFTFRNSDDCTAFFTQIYEEASYSRAKRTVTMYKRQ